MKTNALIIGASGGLGLEFAKAVGSREDLGTLIMTARDPSAHKELQALCNAQVSTCPLDVCDEGSIEQAFEYVGTQCKELHLIIYSAGLLHGGDFFPERKLEQANQDYLEASFRVNASGPLLVAKHALPFITHGERAVLANLSARVGSISDNRSGGWYAYRASKSAQNMVTKTLSIELKRRAPQVICVALHPGTVATSMSEPFQKNVPPEKLFPAERAARQLLSVIGGLGPEDSGAYLDWDNKPIEW